MRQLIKINNVDYPISFNSRAVGTWSHAMGISMRAFANLSDDITILQSVNLLFYALQEGHRLEGKPFTITLDDCWEYTDSNDALLGKLFELLLKSREVKTEAGEAEPNEKKAKSLLTS